jgi:methionyl-tRNA synthetase
MVAKNLGGAMPGPGPSAGADLLAESMQTLTEAYFAAMNGLQLHRALEAVMAMVNAANGYFADNAPWKLAKTDVEAMGHVLHATLDTTRRIVLLAQPVMPEASARLLDLLGVATDARIFSDLGATVAAGMQLPEPQGVFPRWVEPASC